MASPGLWGVQTALLLRVQAIVLPQAHEVAAGELADGPREVE